MIQKIITYLRDNPIIAFPFRFVAGYAVLYGGFLFLVGIYYPGGRLYSPFLLEHFNIVHAVEKVLLYGGGWVASWFGYSYEIEGQHLDLIEGAGVYLGYACIGFGVISFYAAYIWAFPSTFRLRMVFLGMGIPLFLTINMLRVGLLAVIYSENPQFFPPGFDHHASFNTVAYIIMFIILFVYTRYSRKAIMSA